MAGKAFANDGPSVTRESVLTLLTEDALETHESVLAGLFASSIALCASAVGYLSHG